ncbi:ArsB/NhaD family transporter [Candidatus Synechococcus calcipolaris G9]|uniref:ArsB/NhaD family transporter n=1 Tax=Candidatus Synechococcus calcipolaris G9 TaxID=1497997 RepID=A0ABT6EV86_9SYNE|nr:ArsB/NhaD family transporter [Candidatus Synechococcus calcipolaris]MDG2989725.1 ArsB/NhaD family transporter [Candidatus Synechococcus calcipolaris G9]
MENISAFISLTTFVSVILAIMFEKVHLMVAAFLGALILVFTHVMTLGEAIDYISQSHATIALFFGIMVLIRAFEPTQIFSYLAGQMVKLSRGSGKLLLLGIVAITTPICAVLPNATTVMLLAPLIPPLAQDIGIDFAPLLILMVLVANSAGLLTLVGDPATFIVGDGINITFIEYMQRLSLGGVLAIVAIICLLPVLFSKTWNSQFAGYENLKLPPINHPRTLAFGSLIMALVLFLFVVGESLPIPVQPGAVALMGAGLALFLAHQSKIDTVNNILKDVDWSTLIFFMCTFVMIGGLEKTGVVRQLSTILGMVLGQNIALGCIVLMVLVALLSSVVPNIPLVVAMVPLLKQYLFNVNLITAEMVDPNFSGQFPSLVLPLFYAMMLGATLGGNGTLVGASANIVAAGIAELHGGKISFYRFLRYGLPVMGVQIGVSIVFIAFRFL